MANPVVVLDDTLYDIADAIRSKTGGTADMTPSEMPTQIASIPSGGSVGIPKGVNAQGVFGPVTEETVFSLPEDAKDVAQYTFYYAFYGSTGIKKLDAHSLTKVSTPYTFARSCQNASNLEEIDFSNLDEISIGGQYAFQYAFNACPKLSKIDFPKLKNVRGQYCFSNAFFRCTNLVKAEFPILETISGVQSMGAVFINCSSLSSVNFNSLTNVTGSYAFSTAFSNCTSLKELRFPSLSSIGTSYTNQFSNMLSGVTGCTVHFPSSIQSTIQGMSGYPNFGGTNTTVLFDL